MADRDLQAEHDALGIFSERMGRVPQTDEDWASVHKYAYPTPDSLPDELKNAQTEQIYQSDPNAISFIKRQRTDALSDIRGADEDLKLTQKQRQEMTKGSGSFFQTLQEGIREKTSARREGIGKSSIFRDAGLTGMKVLDNSLAMRGKEIGSKRADIQNLIGNLSSAWKSQATLVGNAYDDAFSRFELATKSLNEANRELLNYEQVMNSIMLQNSLQQQGKKTVTLTETDPNTGQDVKRSYIFDARTGGLTPVDFDFKGGATVTSGEHIYDFSTYATDPDHPVNVQSIVEGIGKLSSIDQVGEYINKFAIDSPITQEMISIASEENGVSWEILMALMQQESGIGKSNVATKNNNPGGITWTETYAANHPGTEQGTARPGTEGGFYVKFPTMQDGVNAVAEQIATREIPVPEGHFHVEKLKDSASSGDVGYITADMAASFRSGMDREMIRGGWPAAFNFAKLRYYNRMSDGERKRLVENEVSQMTFQEAKDFLDGLGAPPAEINVGPWNRISEKTLKPWLGIPKDQATSEIWQLIQLGQSKLRNAMFGSQLTEPEIRLSNDFIVDLDKDDLPTIKLKLDNLIWLTNNFEDIVFGYAMGLRGAEIPSVNRMRHYTERGRANIDASTTGTATEADTNYLNSLNL